MSYDKERGTDSEENAPKSTYLTLMARPSDVPNCASVWNTAPPSLCVSSGKAEVTTRAATVNSTA